LNALNSDWSNFSFRQNWIEGLNICFEGTPKLTNGFGHGILLNTENYDRKLIKSELSGKIRFSKKTNNWMTHTYGSYSQLASKVNSSTDLTALAEEISDYILRIIEKEKDSCEIINNHLVP
jgi:hypothetical protein